MAEFRIAVDLSHLIPSGRLTVFPHLAATVEAITLRVEEQWKRYASGEPLPDGRTIGIRSGQYLRSIRHRQISAYSTEVRSDLAYADVIERGAPPFDMRRLLASSLKTRVSKKGKRYLIIPFRHDTGKALSGGNPMPEVMRLWWQDKAASFVLNQMRRPVHSDLWGRTPRPMHQVFAIHPEDILQHGPLLTVAARNYWWGDRLGRADIERMNRSAGGFVLTAGANAKRYQGMVNFRRPGKTGGAAHSQFITFRTLSENAKPGSWIRPARAGYWPAKTTADIFRPVAEDLFTKAVEADIRSVLPSR